MEFIQKSTKLLVIFLNWNLSTSEKERWKNWQKRKKAAAINVYMCTSCFCKAWGPHPVQKKTYEKVDYEKVDFHQLGVLMFYSCKKTSVELAGFYRSQQGKAYCNGQITIHNYDAKGLNLRINRPNSSVYFYDLFRPVFHVVVYLAVNCIWNDGLLN